MVLFLSSRLEFRIHLCIGFLFLNGPWIFFAQRSKPWCSFLLFFRRMGWSDSPPKWLFKTSELAKSAVSLFVEPRLSTVFLVHDLRLRNRFTLCGGHRRAMSYRRMGSLKFSKCFMLDRLTLQFFLTNKSRTEFYANSRRPSFCSRLRRFQMKLSQ